MAQSAVDLRDLGVVAVAGQIDCTRCIDFGAHVSRTHGLERAKLERITCWRDSDVHSPLERNVLAYAEAMTATPPALMSVLAPDVMLVSDGGGRVRAALRPVHTSDKVARFLFGLLRAPTSRPTAQSCGRSTARRRRGEHPQGGRLGPVRDGRLTAPLTVGSPPL